MEMTITPYMVLAANLTGMIEGGLGVSLIIFGIIGWPHTRYVLLWLLGRKPRRPRYGNAKRGYVP
jgi:hypothetical protein